jgi:hypothetical protein
MRIWVYNPRVSAIRVNASICLLSVMCVFSVTAQNPSSPRQKAIWGPPDVLDFRDVAPKPTAKREIIRSLKVAGFPITLEQTDLERAAKHFGAPIGEEGDGANFAKWICLSGQSSWGEWALWIDSGEISGPKVDGFHLQMIERDTRLDRRCKRLGYGDSVVNLPIPITLGMTEKDVITAWGNPSDRYKNTAEYFHEHSVKIDGEPYAVLNSVRIAYRDGKVWAIVAYHSTQD